MWLVDLKQRYDICFNGEKVKHFVNYYRNHSLCGASLVNESLSKFFIKLIYTTTVTTSVTSNSNVYDQITQKTYI